jgi:hypothetical protein
VPLCCEQRFSVCRVFFAIMISSIITRMGWKSSKFETDGLNSLIREYLESQPPLILNTCFCSSKTCKSCENIHRHSILSFEALSSSCDTPRPADSHESCTCYDNVEEASCTSETAGPFNCENDDEKSRFDRRCSDSTMLRRWIHELSNQVLQLT